MSKYEKLMGKEWAVRLSPFLKSEEFKSIGKTLQGIVAEGKGISPLFDDMFKAFALCPYEKLHTVVLTNNAYGTATEGLAFSASKAEFIGDTPKVLIKVHDAVEESVGNGLFLVRDNDLARWARQGVLLLNCDLSAHKTAEPDFHIKLWEPFITFVVKMLGAHTSGINWVLIGKAAHPYQTYINDRTHNLFVLEHPMIAAIKHRPWKHKEIFSRISAYLKFMNNMEMDWLGKQRD